MITQLYYLTPRLVSSPGSLCRHGAWGHQEPGDEATSLQADRFNIASCS